MTISWGTAAMLAASGAHALGAAVLLLLNPRHRSARWFALFLAALALWLFVLGTGLGGSVAAPASAAVATLGRLLPALFAAFAVVDARERIPTWQLLALVAVLVLAQAPLSGAAAPAARAAIWIAASVLLWRSRPALAPRRRQALYVVLVTFAPALALATLLVGPRWLDVLVPLATVGILLVVFVGIVRFRLYEIEVRVARSGALLTEAAAHDRLALLGELAASVAHEVRNPLTGVRSLAQRLAEDDVDEGRRRRYAAVIVGEVERVEALVERLLALARRRSAERLAVDDVALAPLLDDVLLLVGARAAAASVRVEADAAGLAVRGAREALAQVLLNLVLNAIAHAPAGGRVRCVARRDGPAVVIQVTDDGPGVAAEERARLFEPFGGRAGGTGLGLAVSRRLVEEMGGTLTLAESAAGACFEVRLLAAPRTERSALGARLSATAVASAESREPRAEGLASRGPA